MMSKNLFLLSRKNFRYLIHKTVTKNEVIRDLSPRIAEKVSVLKLLKNEWMKNFKKILTKDKVYFLVKHCKDEIDCLQKDYRKMLSINKEEFIKHM